MTNAAASPVHLFHIAYDEATRNGMPAGYQMLDNSAHERDDWREYWPIRRFLLNGFANGALQQDAWYGFFSPRFQEKTGLLPDQVTKFVLTSQPGTDVVTFSPQADMGAFFMSVFEQEDVFQPGFMAMSQAFMAAIGIQVDLSKLIMDSRQIVFSNFFVAKPAFWRQWLDINERLFAICEGSGGPQHSALQKTLTEPTIYPGAVQRKVFLMERIASLILTLDPRLKTRAYNPFVCHWSQTHLSEFKQEAVISDALKIAMRQQGFKHYFDAFSKIRETLG